jgi:dTDP-4-amino-4,6-dideoxygalactose transaminase
MNRKVPFFDYPRNFLDDREDLIRIFKEVGQRGAFIMQHDLEDFEKTLAEFTGSNYAIGVGNATDGLEFCLMAIGLQSGDEVIISSHTMLATASAIITAGGVPVPVDIARDNLIDPDSVENAINDRTVGIMPTQLNGRTCDMDAITKIADRKGLFIVEDAAQALGSKFKDKHAGTFGTASAISFFPAKVLGCLGDAGGVITNDETIFNKIYELHDHGRDINGEVRSWGRNSRMDNLQAAILNFRIKNYHKVISRRREVAAIYHKELSGLEELQLPPSPKEDSDHFDIYQNYEMTCKNRDELREFLHNFGIGTLIQWGGKGVHQWEAFSFNQKLPNVEDFFKHCLMLPMNIFINDDDVYYICNKIKAFYRN